MTAPRSATYPLRRREVVAKLLADRGDLLVIAGLGAPAWDVAAAGDHDLTFPFWGAMGGAAMAGLGLALARPERRVLVITGDGEMLMGLGGLATVAVQKPANLGICIMDNQRYGETGMQETHTEFGVDLPAMARGAGITETAMVYTQKELETAVPLLLEARGPVFVNVKVTARAQPMVLPLRDGPSIKHRFRDAVLGRT
jgi:thiamine pyrophosphate-dependent acetolactate synthase large subunit-like protein